MPMLYSMRLNAHRCTWFIGLPFMFTALLQRQQAHPRNIDCLRTCIAAGDVCPPQVQDQFPSVFGIPLRSSWAATEALGSLTYGLESGRVNRIVKNAQVRGLVDDNRMPVSPGEVGELVVRGPHVTIGYWAGAGLVEDAPEGGWFHTGDLMRQDEKGNLWFVSRKNHLIIRGGSNISPAEVERVLMTHPAVRDAAVIGVPDPELGQRVAGFVQLASSAQSADPDEILVYLTGRLADYKVPESLQIVDEIPRNATGKVDRQSLSKMRTDCSNFSLKKYRRINRQRRPILVPYKFVGLVSSPRWILRPTAEEAIRTTITAIGTTDGPSPKTIPDCNLERDKKSLTR
jgi:long-chain acyl-CoA synthetase/feruloyl-CoA synthase